MLQMVACSVKYKKDQSLRVYKAMNVERQRHIFLEPWSDPRPIRSLRSK